MTARETFARIMVRSRAVAATAALALGILFTWASPATGDENVFTGAVDAIGTAVRWYVVEVGRPGTVTAVLDWSNASADLNLYLQDPLRRTVASATSTTQRPETVTASATIMGRWWIGVRARSGASSYTLSVSYPGDVWVEPSGVDRASQAGIAQVTRSWGTFVQDYDLDGDQDFLYNRRWGSEMVLYANDGTRRLPTGPPGSLPVERPP